MKRGFLLLLCSALLLLGLMACKAEEQDALQYDLYFLPAQGSFRDAALCTESCTLTEEEPVDALLAHLLAGPVQEGNLRSIPEGVTVNGWVLENGVLTVDFSRRYGDLGGIDLTLADYSVTMTLSQLEQVSTVITTVEGEAIPYRERQSLRSSDVTLSLHRTSPVQRQVTLFIPTVGKGGTVSCIQELRSITVQEDEMLTTSTLYALITAAEEAGFTGMPARSDVISVEVQEGVCSLDLVESFYELAQGNAQLNYMVLACLVDSLGGLEHVTAVRFLKEGVPAEAYGSVQILGDVKGQGYTENIEEALQLGGEV